MVAVAATLVVDSQHTIGTRRVIVSSEPDKASVVQLSDRFGARVDHIDPVEGAIGKKVRAKTRVNPTYITRDKWRRSRASGYSHGRLQLENLVGGCLARQAEQGACNG